MKYYFYILSLFMCIGLNAQLQKLGELSTGKMEYKTSILDANKNVTGYILYFNKGLTADESMITYEYIILDKSLNQLANADFVLPFHKKLEYRLADNHFSEGNLYTNYRVYHAGKKKYLGYMHVALDAKNKTVIDTQFIRDFEVTPMPTGKELGKERNVFTYDTFDRLVTKGEGKNIFHVYTHNTTTVTFENKIKELGIFNTNSELVYQYKLEREGFFNMKESFVLDIKDGKLLSSKIVLKMKGLKAVTEVDSIYVKDLNAKKNVLKINHHLETLDKGMPQGYWGQFLEDKMVITTSLVDAAFNMRGFRRTVYDDKGAKLVDQTIQFKEALATLGFGSKKFEDGFRLDFVEVFNFNDFSSVILLEKKKLRMDRFGNNKSKTEDYILIHLNEKSEVLGHYVLEKSKIGQGYDRFLFAQSDVENNALIIYYEDLDLGLLKVKSRNLVVNKFSHGQLTQEKIPYKTENNYLQFNNAKFGHILITAYDEKEIPVSMRLERINL